MSIDRLLGGARGVLAAAVVAVTVAQPASASADAEVIADEGSGLSAPAAVVRIPDSGVWVADPNRGICRVAPGPKASVVESAWCGPLAPEGSAPTPSDGEEVERAGPGEVSGLAFDARTHTLYAADRASSGGSIWRLHLDRTTNTIERGEMIFETGDRVEFMTLGPAVTPGDAPDVYFVLKRAGTILRLEGSAAEATATPVGALADDAFAMTATDEALYVADGGVTRYALSGGRVAAPEQLPGLADVHATAVTTDPDRGRLYVGTSTPDLEDVVRVVDLATGGVELYAQGLVGVTALGVGDGGELLVADDPIVATGAEGTLNRGRLWRVALEPLGRPVVQVTDAPPAFGRSGAGSVSYASRDGASFECRLDGQDFAPCPGTGSGRWTFAGLGEGTHRLSVRATEGTTGLSASRTFVVDWTAPTVTVTPPDGDFVVGGPAPRVRFYADEPGVTFSCSLDGAPLRACWSGSPLDGLAAGAHILRVVGVDAAGNASRPGASEASTVVTIRGRSGAQPVVETPVLAPSQAQASPAAPTVPALREASVPVSGTSGYRRSSRTPLLLAFKLRLQPSVTRSAVRLRLALWAHGDAARLQVTVGDARGRTVLRRTVRVRSDAHNRVAITLTRTERRRLRPGRHRVSAVLLTRHGARGPERTETLDVGALR